MQLGRAIHIVVGPCRFLGELVSPLVGESSMSIQGRLPIVPGSMCWHHVLEGRGSKLKGPSHADGTSPKALWPETVR